MLAGRLWAVGTLLLIPDLLLADGKVSHREKPNVQVIISGDKQEAITLEARQAPLGQVMDEIAGKTGTRVHYSVLPEELVTATCAGATVKQIMECLLGPDADLMFRYPSGFSKDDSPGRPVELWVLGSSFGDRQFSEGARGSGLRAAAGVREDAGQHLQTKTAQTDSTQSKPEDIGKLVEMASGEDPAERANAIARLAADERADEAILRNTLGKALSDEDADVRAQAVYGLARRGGAGISAMLQAALHDRDESVRLMAVGSAGTDAQGVALLREALTGSDETVRALAAMKLGQTEHAAGLPR